MKNIIILLSAFLLNISLTNNVAGQKISLNGSWEITKTETDSKIPNKFSSMAEVPGLVDMANPAIEDQNKVYENSVYWYKRKFTLDIENSPVALLKINKAKYHTKAYLNGEEIGENVFNFTPSVFNVHPFLKYNGQENELLIAVGCQNNLPDSVINGYDFEKTKYIPGIYDDVSLILSGYPYISNIQIVPDIEKEQVRIVSKISLGDIKKEVNIDYVIRESVSKTVVANGSVSYDKPITENNIEFDFMASMSDCKLWSPENPFLYELELSTTSDKKSTKFGMRTFAASKERGVLLLNGKPYFMRGSNVCIFRFFEDPNRASLPWNDDWVTKLHVKFKEMNWNSIRYCIGFPPERWYEIADSLGILIQDEYPIWTLNRRKLSATPSSLAREFTHWMRERWNHPCVVIWDAQNESITDITGEAIQIVRSLDLSNRPWDNGWAAPASTTDVVETHPYLVSHIRGDTLHEGLIKNIFIPNKMPRNGPNDRSPSPDGISYDNPIIINEYAWLWLNRDGSPTTLTDRIYKNFFPYADTPEKRFEIYARYLGMLTEYWRAYRTCAGVLHFCGLGYSRAEAPRGQTSDNFIDLKNLVYEPHFYEYVKPAFNPVGIMIELWDKQQRAEKKLKVPIHLVNDTYDSFSDTIQVTLIQGENVLINKSVSYELKGLEKKVFSVQLDLPKNAGAYQLVAEIKYNDETVKSIRDLLIE